MRTLPPSWYMSPNQMSKGRQDVPLSLDKDFSDHRLSGWGSDPSAPHGPCSELNPLRGADPVLWPPSHQRLCVEDVNICSGASRGSPSQNTDCSEHKNTSEARETSGAAVPLSVCENRADDTYEPSQTPPPHPDSSSSQPPFEPPWTFSFLSSLWPPDLVRLTHDRGDVDRTAGDNRSPVSSPVSSCLFHPMTPALPLNFCGLIPGQEPPAETLHVYPTLEQIKSNWNFRDSFLCYCSDLKIYISGQFSGTNDWSRNCWMCMI